VEKSCIEKPSFQGGYKENPSPALTGLKLTNINIRKNFGGRIEKMAIIVSYLCYNFVVMTYLLFKKMDCDQRYDVLQA